ncbi:MAG TPA: adenylate/guanylate cyclase domain-containing protein, partial [Acidimicrobiales bacterium]|nr:adenylate/guanylate cyclase domain-containing protein [Acidimicrobiales bacterium]
MGDPTGTVSFLFTDIEGSTRLWEDHREAMSAALEEHDRIIRKAVDGRRGRVFATGGDGLAAAFQLAADALAAAVDAQEAISSACLPVPLAVRMAVHTGAVENRDGDYFGPPLNRAARLMAAAHGEQVLTTAVTASLAMDQLPDGAALLDLGKHRLRDLAEPEHVFQVVHPKLRSDFPPLRSLDRYPGNLPIQTTVFIGREAAIAETDKALDEARVVTLTGVGGVGKTRLALQVAADLVDRFGDGAWFVELAPVGAPESFSDAVAQALGVRPRPGASLDEAVLDFLHDKALLLVLDNCEHLLAAAAGFVDVVVRQAPEVRILSTSREGLGLAGERTITVASLEVPPPDSPIDAVLVSESVRLFIERAREVNGAFSPSGADAGVVANLCRRLDGIPLAIELASARASGMTPTEILGHLDGRFRLLTRGRRTATTRHQTLRNTLDWSYDLLEEAERTVLRRLAVFAGDFSLASAEAVVADDDLDAFEVVDHLVRLVEKSL